METINGLSSRSLQYYAIAKKWASDIEFYKYEIKFLRSLLDDCFFNTVDKSDRVAIAEINNELMELDVEKNQLEEALERQLKELELMAEDVVPEDVTQIAGKQIRLEYMVGSLFAEYKELKRDIFSLVEEVSDKGRSYNHLAFQN